MNTRAWFVLGAGGVGKSTLVRELLGPNASRAGAWTVGSGFAAAGPYQGFVTDGPDSLQVTAAQLSWTLPVRLTLLVEGYRYANVVGARMFGGVVPCGALLLVAGEVTLRARRLERGSRPMPSGWYRKQIAAADRASRLFPTAVTLDADRLLPELVADARTAIRLGGEALRL